VAVAYQMSFGDYSRWMALPTLGEQQQEKKVPWHNPTQLTFLRHHPTQHTYQLCYHKLAAIARIIIKHEV
jgi:hypothetical protein